MGRKRKYETDAERHAAYRTRKEKKGRFINIFVPDKIDKKIAGKPGLLIEKFIEVENAEEKVRRELEKIRAHNEKVLRAEIKDKEKQIAELERKNYESTQDITNKLNEILGKRSIHAHRLTKRLHNEAISTLGLMKDAVSALDCDPAIKEHLLVLRDFLEKTRAEITKDLDLTNKQISDALVAIEADRISKRDRVA